MSRFLRRALILVLAIAGATGSCAAFAQDIVKRMVAKHRQSLVYLKIGKITGTGAVVEVTGTGFLISPKGHVLTSCHLIDKVIRDDRGQRTADIVDTVEIKGALASRDRRLEPLTLIDCAQGSIDLALLKFSNTADVRKPVAVSVFDAPSIGDIVASMGFPLGAEFFARPGTMSSEADNDTLLVDMTLNPGDSGAPVFNKALKVIGVAEAGYANGARIGVVRPIRHGALLLQMAGVTLSAVNAQIPNFSMPDAPENSTVFKADFASAIKAFSQADSTVAPNTPEVNVTYAFAKEFGAEAHWPGGLNAPSAFRIADIPAKPGYKITGAKFIVTSQQGVEVLNVGPSSGGDVARATFEKTKTPAAEVMRRAFVKGFIETTQIKLDTQSPINKE